MKAKAVGAVTVEKENENVNQPIKNKELPLQHHCHALQCNYQGHGTADIAPSQWICVHLDSSISNNEPKVQPHLLVRTRLYCYPKYSILQ